MTTCRVPGFDVPDVSIEMELYEAAGSGNLHAVKLLIQDGADICWRKPWPSDGDCSLHQAALHGHGDIVSELLAAGAMMTQVDDRGRTALHTAASMGREDVIKRLLAAGHDPNMCDFDGVSSLHLASSSDHPRTVKILLDAGADPNRINNSFSSPLILAASYGHIECIKMLLKNGANINLVDNNMSQATHAAANWGHEDCLSFLVRHGADIDRLDENDCSPLFLAADNENLACMDILTSAGADCISAASAGSTRRQWRMVELLLQATDKQPTSALLQKAISDVRLSVVATCVQRGTWAEESDVVAALVTPVSRKGELAATDIVEENWLQHVYTESRLKDLEELLDLLHECGLISARTLYGQLDALEIVRRHEPTSLKNMCAWEIRKCVRKQNGEAYDRLGLPHILVEFVAGQSIIDRYDCIPEIDW